MRLTRHKKGPRVFKLKQLEDEGVMVEEGESKKKKKKEDKDNMDY